MDCDWGEQATVAQHRFLKLNSDKAAFAKPAGLSSLKAVDLQQLSSLKLGNVTVGQCVDTTSLAAAVAAAVASKFGKSASATRHSLSSCSTASSQGFLSRQKGQDICAQQVAEILKNTVSPTVGIKRKPSGESVPDAAGSCALPVKTRRVSDVIHGDSSMTKPSIHSINGRKGGLMLSMMKRLDIKRDSQDRLLKPGRLSLAADDEDYQHYIKCPLPLAECDRCRWARNKTDWRRRLPLDPSDPARGSWLICRVCEDGTLRWGCSLCRDAHSTCRYGRIDVCWTQWSNLSAHSRTPTHVHAAAVVGGMADTDECALTKAPPASDFRQVLKELRDGKVGYKKGLKGVGKQKKVRKMRWCLAEAKRHIQIQWYKDAQVASVHQDVGQGLLALRFQTCDWNIEARHGLAGVISLAKEFSLDAPGIAKGTLTVLKQACTRFLSPPFPAAKAPKPEVDEAALVNLCKVIELFDADGAADEQLAGKMMGDKHWQEVMEPEAGGNVSIDDVYGVLTGLKIKNKDKCHASRRIISRPWQSDTYLSKVLNVLVMSKTI